MTLSYHVDRFFGSTPITTRTVEEYWPNGQMRNRYRLPWWVTADEWTWVHGVTRQSDFDAWYENGQKQIERRRAPVWQIREWSETGEVTTWKLDGTGIETWTEDERRWQNRYKGGELVETRTSPPWFTEEEILQAVEGVAE